LVHAEWYDPARFPIYLWEDAQGHMGYGFPRLVQGVKAAVFHDGDIVSDPDAIGRNRRATGDSASARCTEPDSSRRGERRVSRREGVGPFTDTPDTHFLIDFSSIVPERAHLESVFQGMGSSLRVWIGELQAEFVGGWAKSDLICRRFVLFDSRCESSDCRASS
jgi:hypothetical protein